MIMKGQKRKHPPTDVEVSDRSSPTWESQRQFVFSVSLNKYQRGQELPEPSLRRSVLIANTLRQVSLEACRAPSVEMEAPQPPCSPSSALPQGVFTGVAAAKHHSSSALINSCAPCRSSANCHLSASNIPPSVKDEDEDWGQMSTDSDFSLSAAISSILTALDSTIEGGPQAAARTPLRSLENLSGPSDGGVAWGKGQDEWRARETSMEAMRSGYLSELTVEDLFQDIDTSLLERDMGVLGFRGSGASYQTGDDLLRYLPPSPSTFSFSLNQNLRCLPSFSSFSPSSSSSSSSPPFSSQNHVRDGLELEHLMEILVES